MHDVFLALMVTDHPVGAVVWGVQMLWVDGVEVKCYEIEAGKLMVTLQKGWHAESVRDFLVQQDEVDEVEWDSVKYPGKRRARAKKQKPAKATKAAKGSAKAGNPPGGKAPGSGGAKPPKRAPGTAKAPREL